ncbi:MAG TPA: NAD(P)H-binding protein [Bacillota bacterium]|nr:NAD(P)H-binding protein [Bacillota bacterium]
MGRFAFLIHPVRISDYYRKFPALKRLPDAWVEAMFRPVPPWVGAHITGVQSPTGATAEGWFVFLPWTPRMLLDTPWPAVRERIVRAGRLGQGRGAQIFGLGAFTKIAGGDQGASINERLGIPVTTGNSYTAASAVEASLLAAARMGIRPADAEAAVVGATGSIGAACAQLLAAQVGRITLLARQRPRLEELAERLRARGADVRIETDLRAGIALADIVVAVSSATEEILQPEDFKPGAVVCDVARPRNVSSAVYERRDDVLVIDGGVIAVPGAVDFGLDFGFPPRHAEACMAETMILALENRFEAFTLGRDIAVERVEEIAALAKKHGFSVAGFRRFERAVPDEEIERIRERAAARRMTA